MSEPSPAVVTAVPPAKPASAGERLLSLDAYRGFIMLAMASGGFAFAEVFRKNASVQKCPAMQFLAYQFEHVEWVGCSFWDLIQPSFMFMVGVAMAYSYTKRQAMGQPWWQMFLHAVGRAFILVALAVFLSSDGNMTTFIFTNVLAQIGLGYPFLFLLWNRPAVVQFIAASTILVGYFLAFEQHPAPTPETYVFSKKVADKIDGAKFEDDWLTLQEEEPSIVGTSKKWRDTHQEGVPVHWHKNTNYASWVDCGVPGTDRTEGFPGLLNYFPRPKDPKTGATEWYEFNRGGYATLNFIPSLATMIFGLLAGGLLRSDRSQKQKLYWLIGAGLAALAVGWLLGITVCPLVKRIWTPSWAVFSTGWTLLMLAGFYAAIDMAGSRWWAYPLLVVGANSIAMYCMAQLMKPWVKANLARHVGYYIELNWGPMTTEFRDIYLPMIQSTAILLVLWLICLWMYRQKIFVRI
jgi:heparan-alpha-glucosaminide N-acetyltransferase